MSLRWTLGLVALAAALGAWVYFGEIRGAERKEADETAAKRIFGVEPASVTALELRLPDGKVARIVRAGTSEWKLESPVAYPADADAVDRVLHTLSKIQSTSSISPAPADLAPFGLGDQGQKVRVFTGPGEPQELLVGRMTPIPGAKYLSLASDPNHIYTVEVGDLGGLVPTSLNELRDKRLLRAASGSVDELTVRVHGQVVAHAKRADAGWQLTEPEAAPADAEKIQRTLEELGLSRATDFADLPGNPETYGLAQPELELAVRTPNGEERLAFGRASDKAWLRRGDDPVLLALNPAMLTAIPSRTFDYRAKRVLTLETDKVKGLELSYPRTGELYHFDLVGSDWQPKDVSLELRPLKVEDMLYGIAALDATGIESAGADRKALGLEPPLVTVRALDDKGAELGTLSLGDISADKGLPAASSQGAEVWRVSNDLGGQVPLSPESFKNQFVKSAPAPAAAPPAAAPGKPPS